MAPADSRVEGAVRKHLGMVWRVLRRKGLSPADADDAAQDVFWVFARRWQDVAEASERSFLVSTALRVASDRRRSKWNRSVGLSLDLESLTQEGPLPDKSAEERELLASLDKALEILDPTLRDTFILLDIEGLSRREASEILAIPEGTVASRLRSAREELKAALTRRHAIERSRV